MAQKQYCIKTTVIKLTLDLNIVTLKKDETSYNLEKQIEMSKSQQIRKRLEEAGIRYWAGDK